MPLRFLVSRYQALLAIEPVDPLVVNRPALPLNEDMQGPVAVAHPGLGQVPDSNPQGSLLVCQLR